jgi:hypothetical protein
MLNSQNVILIIIPNEWHDDILIKEQKTRLDRHS